MLFVNWSCRSGPRRGGGGGGGRGPLIVRMPRRQAHHAGETRASPALNFRPWRRYCMRRRTVPFIRSRPQRRAGFTGSGIILRRVAIGFQVLNFFPCVTLHHFIPYQREHTFIPFNEVAKSCSFVPTLYPRDFFIRIFGDDRQSLTFSYILKLKYLVGHMLFLC